MAERNGDIKGQSRDFKSLPRVAQEPNVIHSAFKLSLKMMERVEAELQIEEQNQAEENSRKKKSDVDKRNEKSNMENINSSKARTALKIVCIIITVIIIGVGVLGSESYLSVAVSKLIAHLQTIFLISIAIISAMFFFYHN